jgi:N-acetylneuraminic acid mutarotase
MRYNPLTDTWSAMTTVNAPLARFGHAAVWSGNLMVVWGGLHAAWYYDSLSDQWYYSKVVLRSGGRYDPAANTWTPVQTTTAPAARADCAAAWTGSQLIVWGGFYYGDWNIRFPLQDGGRYNPTTDTWSSLSTNGAPAARSAPSTVWTGSRMIVWGGLSLGDFLGDGGRYDPAANTWAPSSISGAPTARMGHTAVWTGSRMVVWGGRDYTYAFCDSGGRYDPVANTWTSTSLNGAPVARAGHTTVWTGSHMLVWGGMDDTYPYHLFEQGGRYDATNNTWADMSILPAGAELGARRNATALWTGSELIVWGGENDGRYLRGGARFDPVINAWTALSLTNTPAARTDHTAVWTGTEMLVWGGYNGQALSSGGRFNPALNTWSAMTTNGAPTARRAHTAVWTGDKMIVWGGYIGEGRQNTFLGTGGRYVPSQDRWSTMSTNSAPVARARHTAVWTGTEMLVWGGYFELGTTKPPLRNYLRSGSSYRPELDLGPLSQPWVALTTKGAPAARRAHTAVWTGQEMIVWGGSDGTALNTGARYLPASGNWSAVTTSDAPTARLYHTAVWTGTQMLIWGGLAGSTEYDTGARYSPTADRWWPITTVSAPAARYDHSAVWTGSEMLIWGGYDGANCLDTIKGYTAPVTLYLYLKP